MECNEDGCKKELPEDRRYNQLYCKTACYAKHNAREAKRRKKEKKKKLKPVLHQCKLISCGTMFVKTGKSVHREYCTDACKDVALKLRQKAAREKKGGKKRVPKEEVITKEPKCTINPMFLAPRGSRMRKKLGLEDTVYNQNRGYSVEMGA